MLTITTASEPIDDEFTLTILNFNVNNSTLLLEFDTKELKPIADEVKKVLENRGKDFQHQFSYCASYRDKIVITSTPNSVTLETGGDGQGILTPRASMRFVGDDVETFYKAIEEHLLVEA